ncbi:4-hydroxythreonine-4-phosphate dehydrogenase PdxA [Candidatus Bathyarchaeota archaeon]|nr:MAG: 4-hydroxythreonine-4-phosphate dehydrogenase PdxA [Candidatus Bathyarchaeota archaeon]
MVEDRPTVGVTIGDPAGIGPEVSVKSLMRNEIYTLCKPVLIGDLNLLEKTADRLGLKVEFKALSSPRSAQGRFRVIEVIDLKNVDLDNLRIGEVSAEAGRASLDYIEQAVKYALRGELDAIVTAPISKRAIRLAGCKYIGHTELIGALAGVEEPLTMFWVQGVRIFFLTRHLPLIEAIRAVKKGRIVNIVLRINREMRRMGIERPRIAVAALNPHASDGGLIGDEEEKEIKPAVSELRGMGIDVYGPIPADSVFHQALEGRYDAVLSLYHDQGHIAAKTRDFYGTVSVTLGLPFVRTSVDHGTAFDIAGRGIANPRSMEEAIKLAAELALKVRSTTS